MCSLCWARGFLSWSGKKVFLFFRYFISININQYIFLNALQYIFDTLHYFLGWKCIEGEVIYQMAVLPHPPNYLRVQINCFHSDYYTPYIFLPCLGMPHNQLHTSVSSYICISRNTYAIYCNDASGHCHCWIPSLSPEYSAQTIR